MDETNLTMEEYIKLKAEKAHRHFSAIFFDDAVTTNHKISSEPAVVNRTMSSPNHPTSNIEDAFSSNFLDFIPASADYVPTSPRKTYSSSSDSFGIVPIASPSILLFHIDPYMKVLQAFYAKELPSPPPNPIIPPVILTPSLNRLRISKFTTIEESFGTHSMSLIKLDFLPYTSDN
nr:hypothetical protein [Tanacetum cinerariifolium]